MYFQFWYYLRTIIMKINITDSSTLLIITQDNHNYNENLLHFKKMILCDDVLSKMNQTMALLNHTTAKKLDILLITFNSCLMHLEESVRTIFMKRKKSPIYRHLRNNWLNVIKDRFSVLELANTMIYSRRQILTPQDHFQYFCELIDRSITEYLKTYYASGFSAVSSTVLKLFYINFYEYDHSDLIKVVYRLSFGDMKDEIENIKTELFINIEHLKNPYSLLMTIKKKIEECLSVRNIKKSTVFIFFNFDLLFYEKYGCPTNIDEIIRYIETHLNDVDFIIDTIQNTANIAFKPDEDWNIDFITEFNFEKRSKILEIEYLLFNHAQDITKYVDVKRKIAFTRWSFYLCMKKFIKLYFVIKNPNWGCEISVEFYVDR